MAVYKVPIVIVETVEKTATAFVEAESAEEAERLALNHQFLHTTDEEFLDSINWEVKDVWREQITEDKD